MPSNLVGRRLVVAVAAVAILAAGAFGGVVPNGCCCARRGPAVVDRRPPIGGSETSLKLDPLKLSSPTSAVRSCGSKCPPICIPLAWLRAQSGDECGLVGPIAIGPDTALFVDGRRTKSCTSGTSPTPKLSG
jgi:hypothetical protein